MSIIVTGGAGFIGSNYIRYLNSIGIDDIIVIDVNFDNFKNLEGLKYSRYFDKNEIDELILCDVEAIIHLGAHSDTTTNSKECYDNNYKYTIKLFLKALTNKIPFVYASSAAVYGNGGFPLNFYGASKLAADKFINNRAVGLRFFNVYGMREDHKGRMKSFLSKIIDGERLLFKGTENSARDYIYVKDVVKIIDYFRLHYKPGVYDVGTGVNTTYTELFKTLKAIPSSIDTPADLAGKLQVNTKADLAPLRKAGYTDNFYTIAEAVKEMGL